jgi:hypothetical protein
VFRGSHTAEIRAKYPYLLEDRNVKRWYDNLARGSQVTADVYLRRLGAFCGENELTPKTLTSMRTRKLEDLLMDYVSSKEKKYSGSYIQSTVKVVKSWLGHNRLELKRRIKIHGVADTPSLKEERVPTREELRRIVLSADKQARVASIMIAHSGLRLETLGDYHGRDGLRIRDLPEMRIKSGEAVFEEVPAMVVVRNNLSKARHQYFSFLSDEGCGYVKDYLDERLRGGERLTGESPLVRPKHAKKDFIRSINIGDLIRKTLRSAGFAWRPYVLRSYFDTQLMLAESKGLVLRDYRQFWMGHRGDVENRYTTNKHRLPQSVIQDMREAYKRSQDYLGTTKPEVGEDQIRQALRKQFLAVAGFSEEEVAKYDLNTMTDEQLHDLVRKRLLGLMTDNGARQRIISLNELEGLIREGWEYVVALPNERAIVKMPF